MAFYAVIITVVTITAVAVIFAIVIVVLVVKRNKIVHCKTVVAGNKID